MTNDATVGWEPRESLKATAEHWSVRGGNRTPEGIGHREAGGRMRGLEAFVGRVADILNHSKRQNLKEQVEL